VLNARAATSKSPEAAYRVDIILIMFNE